MDTLLDLAEGCNFPWLLSNIVDTVTEEPLANALESKIIEWQGVKVFLVNIFLKSNFIPGHQRGKKENLAPFNFLGMP